MKLRPVIVLPSILTLPSFMSFLPIKVKQVLKESESSASNKPFYSLRFDAISGYYGRKRSDTNHHLCFSNETINFGKLQSSPEEKEMLCSSPTLKQKKH